MKFICLLLLIVNCILYSQAQSPLVKQWDTRFGGLNAEGVNTFQETLDGGIIIGGYSNSNIGGNKSENTKGGSDYWVVKLDDNGIKQWDRDFGGTDEDYLYSLFQTFDGGYILGGASRSDSGGDKSQPSFGEDDFWIIKIDSSGNKQWDKCFGGNDFDILLSIIQTHDHGYLLGGFTYSDISGNKTEPILGPPGDNDYWVIKTDSVGNKLWEIDLGGSESDALSCLRETSDKGYVLGGASNSGVSIYKSQPSKGMSDYWLVKLDSTGNILWDKDFGGFLDDALYSVRETSDKGFILHGTSKSGDGGDKTEANWDNTGNTNDSWIIKTDSLGSKEWDKDFGGLNGEDNPGCITQTFDGGYFLSCPSSSNAGGDKSQNNLGPFQTWLLKIDSFGNKQWDRTVFTLGTNRYDNLSTQSKDGCYLIVSSDSSSIGGDKSISAWNHTYDYWVIKFCDTTSTGVDDLFAHNISIYPNPTSENLFIHAPTSVTEIKIFDLFGVKKYETTNSIGKIDVSFLPPGYYFVCIETKGGVSNQKLLIK